MKDDRMKRLLKEWDASLNPEFGDADALRKKILGNIGGQKSKPKPPCGPRRKSERSVSK